MCSLRNAHRNAVVLSVLLGFVFAPSAPGEILQIDATISAEVQEFINGEEGSFDSAFEEFGATSATLPIDVAARLLPSDDASMTEFLASAFADFRDPAVSGTPNPAEFGLEANAYSTDPSQRFASHANANEKRRVTFSAAELDLPENETERPVRSSVFLSGAVVIWSQDPTRDLTGLSAGLRITIKQKLSDADPLVVFEASLTAQGAADAQVVLDPPDGEIVALIGGSGLIAPTADFTEDQLLDELTALGNVHFVIVPEQTLTYLYSAAREVEFELEADFDIEVVNVPDGTGVAAVFGRPFRNLAGVIAERAHTQTKGAALQAAVNAAMADAQTSPPNEPPARAVLKSQSPCGVLGAGMLGMVFALLLAAGGVRRYKL